MAQADHPERPGRDRLAGGEVGVLDTLGAGFVGDRRRVDAIDRFAGLVADTPMTPASGQITTASATPAIAMVHRQPKLLNPTTSSGPANPPIANPIELNDRAWSPFPLEPGDGGGGDREEPGEVAPAATTIIAARKPAWVSIWEIHRKPISWSTAPVRMMILMFQRRRAMPSGTPGSPSARVMENAAEKKVLDHPNWSRTTTARLPNPCIQIRPWNAQITAPAAETFHPWNPWRNSLRVRVTGFTGSSLCVAHQRAPPAFAVTGN